MFLKLTAFGETIVINMDHVYDFHANHIEGTQHGSLLHFTNNVEPYGPRPNTHHKKEVDQSPDTILAMLAGGRE